MSAATTVNGAPTAAPPRASIIIPTCGRRVLLERTLLALTRQTLIGTFEVIVVDDCSADDTPQLLPKFAEMFPRVNLRWQRNEPHAGANASRNRGAAMATAPILVFLDSDCEAKPDWLARLLAPFEEAPTTQAVTGMVVDQPSRSIFDLTFKGTHRVAARGDGEATRLVGGNFAIRRATFAELGLEENTLNAPTTAAGQPDVRFSGRADEEGLYLRLRARGMRVALASTAVVTHAAHNFTATTFFRQAFRGGRAAAQLVYRFHLPPRLDVLLFAGTYGLLLLAPLLTVFAFAAAAGFALAIAAIVYNDLARKCKTVGETLLTFPLLLAYYHARLAGYLIETTRLWLTKHRVTRERLARSTAHG